MVIAVRSLLPALVLFGSPSALHINFCYRQQICINMNYYYIIGMMDLPEGSVPLQDFFEQSRINPFLLPLETSHHYDQEEEIFRFQPNQQAPLQEQLPPTIQRERPIDTTSQLPQTHNPPIDTLLAPDNDSQEQDLLQDLPAGVAVEAAGEAEEESIDTPVLHSLITFLVECPAASPADLHQAVHTHFPLIYGFPVVQVLLDKFSRLKKTKEELIKYCMRKAFKFILELPNNAQTTDKKQRQSLARNRNKYLKRASQQKSMNSKFLHQVFSQGDFARDYFIFLSQLEPIMIEDNQRKIAYLAQLLTQGKGKHKSAEMVRRLPWTKSILEKVAKIAKDLIKFADDTQK